MAFDTYLAERLRRLLGGRRCDEKKMFGGLGILLHGNMLVGIWRDSLIVRLGPDAYEDALLEEHVEEFDITGKPMRGWVLVRPEGLDTDAQLNAWVERALTFVTTLPMKWANT